METKPKLDRKRKFVIFLVICAVIIGAVIIFIEYSNPKPEFLSVQERWQVSAIYDDYGGGTTYVNLTHLGENKATSVTLTIWYKWPAPPRETRTYYSKFDVMLGSFRKGESKTFEVSGYLTGFMVEWIVIERNEVLYGKDAYFSYEARYYPEVERR